MTREASETIGPSSLRGARIRLFLEHLCALVLSATFGFGLGQDYGVDNQVVYMVGSLKILDPSIYKRDWAIESATHYHRAFEYLAALFIALDRGGKGVLVASIVVVTLGMMALYAMIRVLVPRAALPAFASLMLIAIATRTDSAMSTYVFDHILQPSTLGSLGLLVAALFFTKGRYGESGAAVAFGGIFHGNYLVLLFGATIVAHASLGATGLWRRWALSLAAPTVILCILLPVILRTAHSPDSARAQEIYTTIRAPHHFMLRSLTDFGPLAGWQLLGIAGASLLKWGHPQETKRALAFIGGIAVMVWGGIIASVLFHSSAATQLFPWRLAPHLALLSQVMFSAGMVRAILCSDELLEIPGGVVATTVTGAGLIGFAYGLKNDVRIPAICLGLVGAAVLVAIVGYGARALEQRLRDGISRYVKMGAASVIYLLAIAIPGYAYAKTLEIKLRNFRDSSTILHGIAKDERELCEFMRTKTPVDALFITPPGLETTRFHSQRAIVADWKNNPVVPGEVLEWYRRMGELSGRPHFGGWGDLAGYDQMDAARLSALTHEYNADYVVVNLGRAAKLGCFATVFENTRFTVLDLKAPCAGGASLPSPSPSGRPLQ